QEDEAEHDAGADGLGRGRDAGKADGAGESVDQRAAIEQHARGQCAQHEVFQARFGGLGVVAVGGGDHVERKAHQLQPEIQHDEIAGRDQHHHAKGREQDQDRIFEDAARRIGEEFRRQDQRRRRADHLVRAQAPRLRGLPAPGPGAHRPRRRTLSETAVETVADDDA
ncbi:hypothetical protein KXW38_001909, partial [Aspergillus fumigatus]